MPERPEISSINTQLSEACKGFHRKIWAGKSHESPFPFEANERTYRQAVQIIGQHNQMVEVVHGETFREQIRRPELTEKGRAQVAEIICIDGRQVRAFDSWAINTWETAGAIIDVERRKSDGLLIPASTQLCETLERKVDRPLLEIPKPHYDSLGEGKNGCAASALYIQALSLTDEQIQNARPEEKMGLQPLIDLRNKLREFLSPGEIQEILKAPSGADANLLLAEKITLKAIANFYNEKRQERGLPPLQRVGLPILFDTSTMGLEIRHNGQTLSTTQLINQNKAELNQLIARTSAFGQFRDSYTDPAKYLEMSRKILQLQRQFSHSQNSQVKQEIDSFISENFPDLTPDQLQALNWKLDRKMAFQWATGLSEAFDHPYKKHGESYIAVSTDGRIIGKYNLNGEQQFGVSTADAKTAISQYKIGLDVMDGHNLVNDKPRLLFISAATNTEVVSTFREMLKDPYLKALVDQGRILLVPSRLNRKTRLAEEVLNLQAYL